MNFTAVAILLGASSIFSLSLSGQALPLVPTQGVPGMVTIKPIFVFENKGKIEKREIPLHTLKRTLSTMDKWFGTRATNTITFSLFGEKSDTTFTLSPISIILEGYDPSIHHVLGTPSIGRLDIKDKTRLVTIVVRNEQTEFILHKDHTKPIMNKCILEKHAEGYWHFKITQPLEPGSYVCMWPTPHGMNGCWDFDITQ